MRRGNRDAARCTQRAAFGGTDGEVVPAHIEVGSLQSEQLVEAAEFEGAEAIVGQGSDEVGTRHGVMLPEDDDYASDANAPRR